MPSAKQRKNRTRNMLLREQERETVTEVITKKVIVIEEPVVEEEVVAEEEPLDFSEDVQPNAAGGDEMLKELNAVAGTKAKRKNRKLRGE